MGPHVLNLLAWARRTTLSARFCHDRVPLPGPPVEPALGGSDSKARCADQTIATLGDTGGTPPVDYSELRWRIESALGRLSLKTINRMLIELGEPTQLGRSGSDVFTTRMKCVADLLVIHAYDPSDPGRPRVLQREVSSAHETNLQCYMIDNAAIADELFGDAWERPIVIPNPTEATVGLLVARGKTILTELQEDWESVSFAVGVTTHDHIINPLQMRDPRTWMRVFRSRWTRTYCDGDENIPAMDVMLPLALDNTVDATTFERRHRAYVYNLETRVGKELAAFAEGQDRLRAVGNPQLPGSKPRSFEKICVLYLAVRFD